MQAPIGHAPAARMERGAATSLPLRQRPSSALDGHGRERPLAALDWMMGAVVCLCCLGLVMAVTIGGPQPGSGVLLAMKAQGSKLLAGIAVFLVAALLPIEWYRRAAPWLFGSAVGLCLACMAFASSNGAHRWLRIGSLSFQPVELARFALVLLSAMWIARAGERVRAFASGFLMLIGPAAALALVLLLQPDLGNAMLAMALAAAIAIAGGARIAHFLLAGAPLLVAMVLSVMHRGYVQERLAGFADVQPGTQVGQSLVAISSGGLTGKGLGAGWMKMGFVPEAGNDFVFAIVGEELGFLGGALVLGLYALIGAVGLRLTLRMADPFRRMLVFGFTFAICMQAAINLLVVTGLAPAKGIDLPFLSSGGTNLVFSLGAIGIIGNAARSDLRAT